MSARAAPSRLAALRAFAIFNGLAASRSLSIVLVLFAMPILVMSVVGVALRGYTTPGLVLGVLDPGGTAPARALEDALATDPLIHVRPYTDAERMRLAVFRGRLDGGLVVPAGWAPGQPLDYLSSRAGDGTTLLAPLVDRTLARLARPDAPRSGLEVVDGDALGTPPIGVQYTVPANLVLFVLVNAILSGSALAGMRRTGAGRRLLASPATGPQLAAAIAIGPFQLLLVQAAFLVAIGALAFGVDWGSFAGVALVTLPLVACATGASLLVGTLFRSETQVSTIGPFIGLLLGMLGGCMWPLETVPPLLARIGRWFPTAWAMDGYLALIFSHAGWRSVLPEAGLLLGAGALLAALALVRLRRHLSGV